MAKHNPEVVANWTALMEDTASYTVGGGKAYRDSLDLLMATAIEKDIDPYALDAQTLAHINQGARYVIQNTPDIYAADENTWAGSLEEFLDIDQELAAILQGEA